MPRISPQGGCKQSVLFNLVVVRRLPARMLTAKVCRSVRSDRSFSRVALKETVKVGRRLSFVLICQERKESTVCSTYSTELTWTNIPHAMEGRGLECPPQKERGDLFFFFLPPPLQPT